MVTESADVPETESNSAMGCLGSVLGFLLILAIPAVVIGGLVYTYPSHEAVSSGGFVNDVFATRPTLWAARLLVLAAAVVAVLGGVYVVVSIVQWMRRDHWLQQAGPFRVSDKALKEIETNIDENFAALDELLVETIEQNQHLTEALQASEARFDELVQAVESELRIDDDEPAEQS